MVRSPLHFHGRIPVPEVSPLTYRDSVTHLELVYELSQYLKNILHPSLQSAVNQVVADAERLLSEANAQYVDGVEEFQRIHDAFMSDVNASLIALNDGAVSDLVDDSTSLLFGVLNREFTSRDRFEQAVVNAVDFGATPDSPDSTRGIQDAIDYAHEQGIPRVMVNGTHWIQAHLVDGDTGGSPLRQQGGVVLRDNITLDLRGATLKAIPNNVRRYNVVRIDYCDNVTVLGGHIQGERYDHTDLNGGEWGMGIHIHESTNVTIQDTVITECWGDGIYVAAEPGHHNENVYITGVVCRDNRRQGMSIIGGRNIHTYRSVFTETHGALPESGVDIEPNTPITVCEYISFRDCEFSNNEMYGLTAMGSSIKHVLVDGCVVSGNRANTPENGQLRFTREPEHIIIRGTDIFDSAGPIGLELRGEDILVDGCTIDKKSFFAARASAFSTITVQNSVLGDNFHVVDNVELNLKNNRISTVTDTVNNIYDARNVTLILDGNIFTSADFTPLQSNVTADAIFVVKNNIFKGYNKYGIRLRSTGSLTVQGNIFHGQDDSTAIQVRSGSENVMVTNNHHIGDGGLIRIVEATNVYVADNVSPDVMSQTPHSGASNVHVQMSPIRWWYDGEFITLGG